MAGPNTTETLRKTLFDAISAVKSGDMDPSQAKTIALLSDKIIRTAQLELEYARTCSELDKQDQGVSPGPLLLTSEKSQ